MFAHRLKSIRKSKNITQNLIAEALQISPSTIQRWESAETYPTLEQTQAIANFLECPPSVLAFGADDADTIHIQNDGIQYPQNPVIDPTATVAFQGSIGAYSHMSCTSVYPNNPVLPCYSFKDAFHAVESDKAQYAMIPIENSLGGRVADIHHLLPESRLHIVGEHYQPINHCLLGVSGANITDIKSVYSHEQALSQCRHYLHNYKFKAEKYSDTAEAAHFIQKNKDMHKAAIASELAAKTYGLQILDRNIQDEKNNVTRFVILHKNPLNPIKPEFKVKTSCIFQTRDIPASLYKALGGFATNSVNIVKLESYVPMVNNHTVANFYIEFLGSQCDTSVQLALEELEFYTSSIRILGRYINNSPI